MEMVMGQKTLRLLKWFRVIFFGVVMLLAVRPFAEVTVSREYQVKAVFLFNFAEFVTWPSDSFSSPDQPFRIGILGADPFDSYLDQTVQGEKVDGHPLVVERYDKADEAKGCQILFISGSVDGAMGNIIAGLKGHKILTVGDTEDFIDNGGIVRFVTEDNKIHFMINVSAAKNADLVISSQVLRLAKIVGSERD